MRVLRNVEVYGITDASSNIHISDNVYEQVSDGVSGFTAKPILHVRTHVAYPEGVFSLV